ncbi:uncharacterized protein LOC105420078 isoform X2 [Amborella trichopoda]|uniref:uncharacterized protein LOC105420078 isoform X2 n=1 Tax=Amborella trichopoda TaxID=13333 RepID=UPI0009C0A6DF|nr:uncharacterized protein LOC105420078 isoform X2 [Amborella trichopoda]|eukprot:XP_020518252.1 uncharacterized protein LOC105420078 isoform X2 [Amborella trichopoda]
MIILRSFSRVEQVSKVSKVIYELPKLVSSFQGSNYYGKVCLRKMGDMKDVVNAMDQSKKRRAVRAVWMPLSAHLSSSEDLGIDKSIFINPKTFHLTVLMLKLWNEERVATAAEVLQKVSPKVMNALKDHPISIRLKGLDCMRGSVSEACVLYTPVEEIGGEGRLMRACQVIIDAYVKAGLVLQKDACQKLKLHGTVMNVKFRKRTTRTRKIGSFDARDIFERYGSEEWDLGIDKSIFINPKTFLLTVLMLKLWNEERVATAAEVLQKVSPKVMRALKDRPISIRLKGLLHGTVMNVKFRKRTVRTRKIGSFDARDIFEQYGSEEWGEYVIGEAHLSQRFKYERSGYYHRCASIPFP